MNFTSYRGFGSNLLSKLLGIKYRLLVIWDRGSEMSYATVILHMLFHLFIMILTSNIYLKLLFLT